MNRKLTPLQVDIALVATYVLTMVLFGGLFQSLTIFVIYYFTMIVLCGAWIHYTRHRRAVTDLFRAHSSLSTGEVWKWIVTCFLGAYAIQVGIGILLTTLLGVQTQDISNADEVMRLINENRWFIIVTALGAPIIEEVIFRGILFRRLVQRFGYAAGLWGSSLLFALGHLVPLAIVTYMLLGMLLAYLYHRTSRLWAPIVLHMMINTFALLIQFMR